MANDPIPTSEGDSSRAPLNDAPPRIINWFDRKRRRSMTRARLPVRVQVSDDALTSCVTVVGGDTMRGRETSSMVNQPERSSSGSGGAPSLPRVALLIETQIGPGRDMLRGIARYVRESGPWELHLEQRMQQFIEG